MRLESTVIPVVEAMRAREQAAGPRRDYGCQPVVERSDDRPRAFRAHPGVGATHSKNVTFSWEVSVRQTQRRKQRPPNSWMMIGECVSR